MTRAAMDYHARMQQCRVGYYPVVDVAEYR